MWLTVIPGLMIWTPIYHGYTIIFNCCIIFCLPLVVSTYILIGVLFTMPKSCLMKFLAIIHMEMDQVLRMRSFGIINQEEANQKTIMHASMIQSFYIPNLPVTVFTLSGLQNDEAHKNVIICVKR